MSHRNRKPWFLSILLFQLFTALQITPKLSGLRQLSLSRFCRVRWSFLFAGFHMVSQVAAHLKAWLTWVRGPVWFPHSHLLQMGWTARTDRALSPSWCTLSISSVQSLSSVWLFAIPWIAGRQTSLSITNSWSSLKPMSIESVMPSSHLILCRPVVLLPPIPPSISLFQWINTSQEVTKAILPHSMAVSG